MSFVWNFFDITDLDLYGIVFNNTNQAFNINTSGFSSYSDSNIANFVTDMVESPVRKGYYIGYLSNTTNIPRGIYKVEIYKQTAASPSKNTDVLRGVGDVYWNGNTDVPSIMPPKLEDASNIGQVLLGQNISFIIHAFDLFGMNANLDANPFYQVYSGVLPMNVSGNLTQLDTGRYGGTFTATSGVFGYNIPYSIKVSGVMNNTAISTNKSFEIKSPAIIEADLSTDVLGQLGYPTGVIASVSSTSQFTTNLPSSLDDVFNGAVLRIVSTGNMYGVARIVSDYVGSSKTVVLNKALPATPDIGTRIIVFPIGGQLNVN